MKELSIEEKAARYDDAIRKATVAHKDEDRHLRATIERIFPELVESEDEKIRKAIIEGLRAMKSSFRTISSIKIDDAIAWLEQQGENKPTDKVEPKFKNGQWIVWNNKNYKVNDNGCGYELIDQDGLKTPLVYGIVDESAHLWDVTKDGQDGEVLVASDNSIFIFKEVWGTSCKHYIALTSDNEIEVNTKLDGFWETTRGVKPAFKEQSDILFARMKEEGYEWKDKKIIENPKTKEPTCVDEEYYWSNKKEHYLSS